VVGGSGGGGGGKNNRTRKLSIRAPSFSDRKSTSVCVYKRGWVVVVVVVEKAVVRCAHKGT